MVDSRVTVGVLRGRAARSVRARDWGRFHNPKDLSTAMTIEASELLEQFLREPAPTPPPMAACARTATADGLADAVVYALTLCNALDLDLSDAVSAKLVTDEAKYPADRFRGRAPAAGGSCPR